MSDKEKTAPAKGLEGVVAATTKLSSVRGLDGELIYRGYNINELAGKATYEEVVHLLHRGKLPNQAELDSLKAELAAASELPGGIVDLIRNLPKEASPMRAISPQRRNLHHPLAGRVEHGGSGGRAAGPIANQGAHGLIEEGYFDDVEVRR